MSDIELLERAAKAIGLRHVCYDGLDYDGKLGLQLVDGIGRHTDTWSPLTDDGDAFRLAVKLNMFVDVQPCVSGAQIVGVAFVSEEHGDDQLAATRRAIVRAAAAMAGDAP